MAKIYVVTYELPAHASIQVEAKNQDEAYKKADRLIGSARFDIGYETAPEIIDIQEYDSIKPEEQKRYDVVLEKRNRVLVSVDGNSAQDAANP